MREPIVLASRQLKPENLAATVHPVNLPKYASEQIATVKAQVIPMEAAVSTRILTMI